MPRTEAWGLRSWLCVMPALILSAGCGPRTNIYDAYALTEAKRVAVMPGLGAPGPDGRNAGLAESSLLITALADLDYYQVEGPGRMRKAVKAGAATRPAFSRSLQAEIADRLDIDLLVLADVTDYRFTKQWKSASWLVGSSQWTETTYWAGVDMRIIKPDDGRIVYSGSGSASSKQGYGPALRQATGEALAELARFIADARTRRGKK